jgi:hypothetical protein
LKSRHAICIHFNPSLNELLLIEQVDTMYCFLVSLTLSVPFFLPVY